MRLRCTVARFVLAWLFSCTHAALLAQPDCALRIGTNLGGLADYMTEMPFVYVMHHARPWYTTTADGNGPFNSETIDQIPKDAAGYPLELPYSVNGQPQIVKTIWASLAGWPEGTYTLLYDGDGDIDFWGDLSVVTQTPGRITLNFQRPSSGSGLAEMRLRRSNVANRLKNIRLLMPGTETTYLTQPFYAPFLARLAPFKTIRFMDWGSTNNWGHDDAGSSYDQPTDSIRTPWADRAQPANYT